MNRRMVFRIISFVLLIEAIAMLPALILSLVFHEPEATRGFGITILLAISLASIDFLFPPKRNSLYATEGYVITALSWIIISVVGCLPFLISGALTNFFEAFFEIVSGFTTTGATILKNIEGTYRSLLFWRSFTHWLGGMGVLVFLLAIVSMTGSEGNMIHLLRAESPGYDVGKMTPKLKETAMTLYFLYIALTILEFVILMICGMPPFDAICITFGTAGTGGFGVTNNGLAAYNPACQTVATVFMLVFGVNFSIYFLIVTRQFSEVKINEELWTYLGIFTVSAFLIAFNTLSMSPNFKTAFHHSAFQVASIMTTTGFNTVDFDLWPWFSKTILVILMFIGASAGSTGGGIKVSRLLIAVKAIRRQGNKILHPRSIRVLRMNQKGLDEAIVQGVLGFLATYILLLFGSVLIISLDNFNLETNFTAVLSCLSNIGPGLSAVGPTSNFTAFSNFSKVILSFDMLLGRLELFPVLILFNPHIWRRNSGRG